ncbi:hypothetical protein AB0M20_04425 [Actinoplanes sp. NPDC051633]|uniref:hypothetical protein n=1 Tax=Actinoplanes sp. NPDC051633 TaxID=3155670 RepID=UPI003439332B
MSRPFVAAPALAALAALAALLAGCGAPPEPLPTSPPRPAGSAGEPSSSIGVPTPPAGTPPAGGVPTGTGYPLPGATLPTTRVVPTTPTPTTTPPPPPAPVCTAGPSKQQMLDLVKGKPGIPTKPLEVRFGPYCARTWQFAILGLVGEDEDTDEPLLVVSSGKPSKLTLVEAGADVCSDRVTRDAPPGIRVRACGS